MTVPADRPDAELLAAHVAGDPSAFGELVARHRDRAWALALRTCRDANLAEDAVQEAFLAVHRRAASFRGDAAVTTWLHRIVVNACLDRIRRNAVRRAEPLEAVGRAGERPGEDDTVREAEAAGFDTIVGANHNRYKVEVHEANHPHVEHWIADLINTDSDAYHSVRELPAADLLVADAVWATR